MKTDRELLELAAKAAGYSIHSDAWAIGAGGGELKLYMGNLGPEWNPLTDDGDALRLAVKMELLVDTHGMYARVCFPYEAPLAYQPMTDDRIAATRRAIVRAAAAIGEAMP